MKEEPISIEFLDLEDYVSNGKKLPLKHRHFIIRIDGKRYKWSEVRITGKEVLELAGKKPLNQYRVDQYFRFGRVEQVEADEVVDLAARGVERFTTAAINDCKITVFVNGRPREVEKTELTYEEVVKLAYPNAVFGPNIVYTVTYKGGGDECKPQGQLTSTSPPVTIRNNTKFNVSRTDKS